MVVRRGVKVEEQRVEMEKAVKRRRVLGVEVKQRRATTVVLQDGTSVVMEELHGTSRPQQTVVSNGENG